MQEGAARDLSEEEQAMCSYYRSHRRTSKGSEWMSRYIAGHSELHAQSFQDVQSSSYHVQEAEQKEQCIGQQRVRRLKRIQEQQKE